MVRHALKMAVTVLLRRKGFSALCVVVVATTLAVVDFGAATFETLLGGRLPVAGRGQLLHLGSAKEPGRSGATVGFSLPLLERHVRELPGVERMAIFASVRRLRVDRGDRFSWARAVETDPEFFRIYSLPLVAGRTFSPDGPGEVVLSQGGAALLFQHDDPLGQVVSWPGGRGTVVGVVAGRPFTTYPGAAEAWVNRAAGEGSRPRYEALLLLRPKADLLDVQRELKRRLESDPEVGGPLRSVLPWPATNLIGPPGMGLIGLRVMLVGLALVFMLLPAVSLSNVIMGGLVERQRELGLRRAFGASSRQLMWQLWLENLVLCGLGATVAAAGLYVAAWPPLGGLAALGFRYRGATVAVLGYLGLFTVLFCLLTCVVPARRLARMQPLEALRGGLS